MYGGGSTSLCLADQTKVQVLGRSYNTSRKEQEEGSLEKKNTTMARTEPITNKGVTNQSLKRNRSPARGHGSHQQVSTGERGEQKHRFGQRAHLHGHRGSQKRRNFFIEGKGLTYLNKKRYGKLNI